MPKNILLPKYIGDEKKKNSAFACLAVQNVCTRYFKTYYGNNIHENYNFRTTTVQCCVSRFSRNIEI